LRGKGLVYRSPIVRLRQMFDLYINLRPCKAYRGNPLNYRDDIDLVVFRENTEGLYAGVEFHPVPDHVRSALEESSSAMGAFKNISSSDMAITARIITRRGAERIVRAAFEYAQKHGRKTVTLVEKPNVLRETSGLMTRVAREVAKEFASRGIEMWEANVDAIMMWLVKNPQQYGVIVTSNLFGDVVSDLCAQLVGGLGFAASGNIGEKFAVFEPTHGSAPKHAGLNKANPMATFLAVKLMLDWLGEAEKATQLERAIAAVIEEGRVRTYDMGGKNTTMEMGAAVASAL
jgi:3-isopropylmalate dehydrogenase